MWTLRIGSLALFALLTACVQLPPTPQDIQAKRFESAPGKAVVYLVRTNPDLGDVPATVMLNYDMMGATYMGTYFRWELPPGRHRIAGYASDHGTITVDVQPDRMYFVQQVVRGGGRAATAHSTFHVMDERQGRAAVLNGMRVGHL